VDRSGMARQRRESNSLTSFLEYLEEIETAVVNRDSLRVTALLRKRTATHLPRAVREELLMLSRASRDSLRAPVQFLRFQHRMTALAKTEPRLPTAQTELQLESPASAGTIRRREASARRSAACDQSDDGGDESQDRDDQRDDPGREPPP
jgi:hypothetical protein